MLHPRCLLHCDRQRGDSCCPLADAHSLLHKEFAAFIFGTMEPFQFAHCDFWEAASLWSALRLPKPLPIKTALLLISQVLEDMPEVQKRPGLSPSISS